MSSADLKLPAFDPQEHATEAGREFLAEVVPPHESYEGYRLCYVSATWTPEEEASVRRIIDFRLLVVVCLMFLGLQLNRGNLSNALTDNLLNDLKLTTDDYNNGSSIQLVCFLATEFPVQMLIKRYGFKRILPTLMICWGLVSTFQCFMTNRTGFYITRALIGACEGGFIPGTILYCTYFYTSSELAIRLAVFWSTLNLARIVSSLLAAGILEMRGVRNWAGWRWLFMLEGLFTIFIAILLTLLRKAFLALPSSPVGTKGPFSPHGWFTPKQEVIAVNRILRDDPAKGLTAIKEPLTWADIKDDLSDKSMWGLYLIGLIAYIPASPVQGYLSLTLKTLGFSTFDSNMLSIPSAVLQIILMLALAFSSDFFGERTFHCFMGEFWCLPLLIALETMHGKQSWSRFTITTLISGYPYFHPIVSAWISENFFSVKKRAVTAATYNVIVQVGSVVSSQIYRTDDKPYYYQGDKVLIAICCGALATFICQRVYLVHLNQTKLRKWNAMSAEEQLIYQKDTEARKKDGNERLDFLFKY